MLKNLVQKENGFHLYNAFTGSGKTQECAELVVDILTGKVDEQICYACFRKVEIIEFLMRVRGLLRQVNPPIQVSHYMNKLFVKFGKNSCEEILKEIEKPIYTPYDKTWIKSILRKDNDFVIENFKYKSAEKWERFHKAKVKIMSTESLHHIDFNKNIKLIIDELPFNFLRYYGKYTGDEDLENLEDHFKFARKFKNIDNLYQIMAKNEAKRFEKYYSIVNDGISSISKLNKVHNNTIVMSASYYTMNLYRMF
jgi:hypothetical protein